MIHPSSCASHQAEPCTCGDDERERALQVAKEKEEHSPWPFRISMALLIIGPLAAAAFFTWGPK